MKKAGILFHPNIAAAIALGQELADSLTRRQVSTWLCSSWDEERAAELVDGTDFVCSIGGDGTILRAARIVFPRGIPIVGVNLGRLGFLAELAPQEALEWLPHVLNGEGWLDERAMLEAQVLPGRRPALHALNDMVVARGGKSRAIQATAILDGEVLTTYRCDGVVVATPTGSTGYSLAAGGPILHPQSSEIVLQPIAPHLGMSTALVLPAQTTVELEVSAEYPALLSADGQVEVPLENEGRVRIRRSTYVTRLWRFHSSSSFYGTLMSRLARRSAAPQAARTI